MKKNLFVIGLAMCAFSACSTQTALQINASNVRVFEAEPGEDCAFLGDFSEYAYESKQPKTNARSAQNKLRNSIANAGGNAVFITDVNSVDVEYSKGKTASVGISVKGKGYLCK